MQLLNCLHALDAGEVKGRDFFLSLVKTDHLVLFKNDHAVELIQAEDLELQFPDETPRKNDDKIYLCLQKHVKDDINCG